MYNQCECGKIKFYTSRRCFNCEKDSRRITIDINRCQFLYDNFPISTQSIGDEYNVSGQYIARLIDTKNAKKLFSLACQQCKKNFNKKRNRLSVICKRCSYINRNMNECRCGGLKKKVHKQCRRCRFNENKK